MGKRKKQISQRLLGPLWYALSRQSYVIKSAPWTILWFRILGIFSGEYIKRLCVFMFQTCSNSQLLRRVLWISAEQTIGAQPLYIFNRVRVLHLNRLKEQTWLHSFGRITSHIKGLPQKLTYYYRALIQVLNYLGTITKIYIRTYYKYVNEEIAISNPQK